TALNHFARGRGVLALGLAVKITDADGPEMHQRGQRNQNGKERVSGRRRRQRLWSEKRFLNAKRAGARDHFSERPPPQPDTGPNCRASAAILPTAFESTPASADIRQSGHRLVPHDPKSAAKSHAFELIERTFNR